MSESYVTLRADHLDEMAEAARNDPYCAGEWAKTIDALRNAIANRQPIEIIYDAKESQA